MWVSPYYGITANEKTEKYADLTKKNIPNITINNILTSDIKNYIYKKSFHLGKINGIQYQYLTNLKITVKNI